MGNMNLQQLTAKLEARFCVGSMFFIHGLCFSSWGARIPSIQTELALSEAALGTVLFSVPIGSLLSMPAATYLVRKFNSRLVLQVAIAFYSLALITLGLAQSAFTLSLALIVFGILSNMVNVSVNTQAVNVESRLNKTVMASLHGLWSLAGFIGAALGALMIALNVAPMFHFMLVCFITSVCLFFTHSGLTTDEKMAAPSSTRWRAPNRELVGLGLIAFCSMICEGAMFDWSGVYFQKVIGTPTHLIGLGYVSFMLTMAATRFMADRLINDFGVRKVLKVCSLTIVAGLFLSIAVPHLATGIIGFLLVGAGTSAVVPLVFSQAGKIKGQSSSYSIAVVSTIGFLGFLFGPPFIGWIAELSSLRISFLLIAFMGLAIYLLAYLQYPPQEN